MQRLTIACCSLIFIVACHKSTTSPGIVDQAGEEKWLVSTSWQFAGSANLHHAVIFDSVRFFQLKKVTATQYLDSIAAYYPMGIIAKTTGIFYIRSSAAAPDTLVSPFSPYTFSGSQTDTFLIYHKSDRLGLMQFYSIGVSYNQQDSLVHN